MQNLNSNMKCKWYEQIDNFPGDGSCDKPLKKLTRPERLKTGKIYEESSNQVVCQRCIINNYVSIPLIILLVAIPYYAITRLK